MQSAPYKWSPSGTLNCFFDAPEVVSVEGDEAPYVVLLATADGEREVTCLFAERQARELRDGLDRAIAAGTVTDLGGTRWGADSTTGGEAA